MLLNILVSTIDEGIGRVEKILLDPRPDVKYVISHQVTDERYRKIPAALGRSDIAVGQIEGRGLSRNRNHACSMAEGDIAIIADDDVCFRDRYIDRVIEAFKKDPDMGVACFRIATPAGEPEYKDYALHSFLLNDESHHYISSLEIACRLDLVKKQGIVFDERFGLGSKQITCGEEAVFIHDCIKAGLKVKYVPEYVVEHPVTSTGKSISEYDAHKVFFKGAYDARRFGWLAFPAAFWDTARLWTDIAGNGKKPLDYLAKRLQGVLYICREKKV